MGDKEQEACSTGLGLGIGVGEFVPEPCGRPKRKQVACLDLSFPLYPKEEVIDACCKAKESSSKFEEAKHGVTNNNNCDSNTFNDRDSSSSNNNNCGGKKLRLRKDQSTLLEETFKLHSTLNPTQKQTLAEKLNLQPRQVEVWFQNRRARTKLKQTEVNCGFLKKFCESLSDENRRLKKELQELQILKFQHHSPPHPPPFYFQLGNATTLSTCPSCEKFGKIGGHPTSVAAADASTNSNAKNETKEREEAAVVMDLVCKKESDSGSSSSDKQLKVSFS